MSATAYVNATVPRVVADLLVGPEEPPRMIRPPAETVDEAERWLRLQSHALANMGLHNRLRLAKLLLLARYLADRRRTNGR